MTELRCIGGWTSNLCSRGERGCCRPCSQVSKYQKYCKPTKINKCKHSSLQNLFCFVFMGVLYPSGDLSTSCASVFRIRIRSLWIHIETAPWIPIRIRIGNTGTGSGSRTVKRASMKEKSEISSWKELDLFAEGLMVLTWAICVKKNYNETSWLSFFNFGQEKTWIRNCINLKCWIWIRIELNTDPKPTYFLYLVKAKSGQIPSINFISIANVLIKS